MINILILFLPIFPFDLPWKQQRALGFQGDQKGTLGRNELIKLFVQKPFLIIYMHFSCFDFSLSSRFHSYSPTVRLCKKWLAFQMLSDYFEEEAIELLVANLFINPQPLKTPKYWWAYLFHVSQADVKFCECHQWVNSFFPHLESSSFVGSRIKIPFNRISLKEPF